MRIKPLLAGAGALALATTLVGAPAQAHSEKPRNQEPHVLASGLAGPLTLAVGQRRDVYVTEVFAPRPTLTKVDRRGAESTVYEMPNPPGTTELVGVAYDRGSTYHVETDHAAEGGPTSHVVKTNRNGQRTIVSDDLWDHEARRNPDAGQTYGFHGLDRQCAAEVAAYEAPENVPDIFTGYRGIVESHAYQLEVHLGTIYVADAAANAVLKVDEHTKRISTVAAIPASPIRFTDELEEFVEDTFGGDFPGCTVGERYAPEPVPTDIAVGRRGELFVSTLQGGAGEVVPISRVHRIEQRRGPDRVTTVARGLFGATGLDRTRNGDLYVAEMFGDEISVLEGRDVRHAHPGHLARAHTLFEAETPADVQVSGRHLYATVNATAEPEVGGDLVRYELKHHGR
ncbi:ScyD/ScyE family protein [Citricoccus sp. SGAir0253]|uniref:ScyD/ScyE family protein n=1 Tax=Citricoccus sp. SGAir0253 TaxID=2567881 RepID=UPI00143D5FF9|nr:ScyD/ScyE family protein [Citricoccus sp. SGAir0253]